MFCFLIILFVIYDSFANILTEQKFANWQLKYKTFSVSEYHEKLKIFQHNDNLINYYNNLHQDLTLEHNQHSCTTFDNYFKSIDSDIIYNTPRYVNTIVNTSFDLQSEVDWRKLNVVTPIVNQHECASCWIFASINALESAYAIKYNKLINLSVQQILDCGIHGCDGGLADSAYHWISNNNGICNDVDYSYKSVKQQCNNTCVPANGTKLRGFVFVNDNEIDLSYAISLQPVVATIHVKHPIIQFYKSGVLDIECKYTPNHSVLIVGYTKDYYIVKNSWGTNFGINGYMFIKRYSNYTHGSMCITYNVIYPLL